MLVGHVTFLALQAAARGMWPVQVPPNLLLAVAVKGKKTGDVAPPAGTRRLTSGRVTIPDAGTATDHVMGSGNDLTSLLPKAPPVTNVNEPMLTV